MQYGIQYEPTNFLPDDVPIATINLCLGEKRSWDFVPRQGRELSSASEEEPDQPVSFTWCERLGGYRG